MVSKEFEWISNCKKKTLEISFINKQTKRVTEGTIINWPVIIPNGQSLILSQCIRDYILVIIIIQPAERFTNRKHSNPGPSCICNIQLQGSFYDSLHCYLPCPVLLKAILRDLLTKLKFSQTTFWSSCSSLNNDNYQNVVSYALRRNKRLFVWNNNGPVGYGSFCYSLCLLIKPISNVFFCTM